jgi:hypothetical protein
VTLGDGRVDAIAPPGMTHAIFCLIDENKVLQQNLWVKAGSEYAS